MLVRDPWSHQPGHGPWTPCIKAVPSRFLWAQLGSLCPFLRPFLPWATQQAGSGAWHGCHQRKGPWGCLAFSGLCLRFMLPALFLAGSDPSTLFLAAALLSLGRLNLFSLVGRVEERKGPQPNSRSDAALAVCVLRSLCRAVIG